MLLILDESPGVSAEIIAQDILGLLRQDVSGRHEVLLLNILDLLNSIVKYSPTDELRGCSVPISIMPIFFDMRVNMNITKRIIWRTKCCRPITFNSGGESPWCLWK